MQKNYGFGRGLDSTRVTLRIRLRTRISDSTGGDVISRLPKAGRSREMKGDNRGSRSSSWNSKADLPTSTFLPMVLWYYRYGIMIIIIW